MMESCTAELPELPELNGVNTDEPRRPGQQPERAGQVAEGLATGVDGDVAPGRSVAGGGFRRADRGAGAAAGNRRSAAADVALVHPARASRSGRTRRGRPPGARTVPAADPGTSPDVGRRQAAPGRAGPDRCAAIGPLDG